jgi:hypothetical protein
MPRARTSLSAPASRPHQSEPMQSESARATSRNEARFRIDYPNSTPRLVKVIALDEGSRARVDEIAALPWARAVFFTLLSLENVAAPVPAESGAVRAWLRGLAGETKSLIEEIDNADLVVMVVSAGSRAEAALLIGEACHMRNVTAIGLVLRDAETTDTATERTIETMRPFATTLVIANGAEYIEAMLTALRA